MTNCKLIITSSQKAEADEANLIVTEVIESQGAKIAPAPKDNTKTKKVLELGLSLEFFVGLPAGVAVGMIANEIHRRLLKIGQKPNDVSIAQRDGDVIVTHNGTGLQIVLREAEPEESDE